MGVEYQNVPKRNMSLKAYFGWNWHEINYNGRIFLDD
jgi:hypothetical protein